MFTVNDSLAAETYWAQKLGVPVELAHATAEVESHHDPYAVGDHGTSFGDYQLHRGGLLGSLSKEQAFNPWTNARIAIQHLADTHRKYPSVKDPGALAALSQGPADRNAYRDAVNAQLHTGGAGATTGQAQTVSLFGDALHGLGSAGSWTYDHSLGWVFHGVGSGVEGAASAVSAPFVAIYNLFRGIWDFFTSQKTWIRIGFFVGGFVIIVAGVRIAFGQSPIPNAMPVPVPV